jgi:hypothetical protein
MTPEEAKRNYEIVAEGLRNPPTTSADLYVWLAALTGFKLPHKKVCENHVTPWDFIWQAYRVDLPEYRDKAKRNMVYVGPRGGYKTIATAMLIAAEILLKPNCDTAGMGAIEKHAQRTYNFVRRWITHPAVVDSGLFIDSLMEKTTLANAAVYTQVCATRAGVNSIHPQKLRTEENDLIQSHEVVEEAKMTLSSWGGLKAHATYVSTRKYEDGNVDKLIQNANPRDFDVLISCYKDSSERCTEARRGAGDPTYNYEVEDIFNEGQTVHLKAYKNCGDCPLLPSCRGDLARASGIVPIDDLINEWNTLERETWMWQKECIRGKSSNSFFSKWNEDLQVGSFPYREDIGWVDMSWDFTGGGKDPTVIGFWQTDAQDNDYLIAELEFDGDKTDDYVAEEVWKFVTGRGWKVRFQFGDSAAMSWITNLNAKEPGNGAGRGFFKIKPVRKIHRRDGWALMRQRIRDNSGHRKIYADRSCRRWLKEVKDAKRSKQDPSDIHSNCSDHSLDQGRYRLVELRFHGLRIPNIRLLGEDEEGAPVVANAKQGSKGGEDRSILPRLLHGNDHDED